MTYFHKNLDNQKLIEIIGKRIFILRKKKGLSREKLAVKIGVSKQQIFKYEIGENKITVDKLVKIALALDVEIIEFFQIDNIHDKNNDDYDLLKHLSKLQNLSADEFFKRFIEIIVNKN